MRRTVKCALASLLLLVVSAGQAKGSIVVRIERLSDTEGILTASGTIDEPVGNTRVLTLLDPFEIAPVPNNNRKVSDGIPTLQLGDDVIVGAHDAGSDRDLAGTGDPTIYFYVYHPASFEQGDSFNDGELMLSLSNSGTLAAVGETGDVRWSTYPHDGPLVGTWEIVASSSVVPEPASLIIWSLLGILGLGVAWYRR